MHTAKHYSKTSRRNISVKRYGEKPHRKPIEKQRRRAGGNFPSGAAACEINEKGETPLLFRLDFRVFPVICFWFRSADTETTGSFSEFANCQSIGNRGFSSSDSAPSGAAAVFSVPDALLRSPALFADEISYSAKSELILVLCTILAKAPISRAAK